MDKKLEKIGNLRSKRNFMDAQKLLREYYLEGTVNRDYLMESARIDFMQREHYISCAYLAAAGHYVVNYANAVGLPYIKGHIPDNLKSNLIKRGYDPKWSILYADHDLLFMFYLNMLPSSGTQKPELLHKIFDLYESYLDENKMNDILFKVFDHFCLNEELRTETLMLLLNIEKKYIAGKFASFLQML